MRKTLAEEKYSAFEEIEDLKFEKYYGMKFDWEEKMRKAKMKRELTKQTLRVTKLRLKAAQSENSEEMIDRDIWIGWFKKVIESRRIRMNDLKRSVNEVKRAIEPYD